MLNEQNIEHIITREPGGTETGEQIRKILLQGNIDKLDSYSEFLCFAASRREHLKKIILPALSENKIVICDRFLDSSIVYQGMVGGLDEEIILNVHDNFCYKKYPDLTLLLDVNPKIGLARKNKITLVENHINRNFKQYNIDDFTIKENFGSIENFKIILSKKRSKEDEANLIAFLNEIRPINKIIDMIKNNHQTTIHRGYVSSSN